jgi:hypothetical protein
MLLDLCDLLGLYYSNGSVHTHVKPVSILFWAESCSLPRLCCVGSSPPLLVAGRRWASTSASLASGPGAVWSLAAGCRIPRPFNLPPLCPQSAHTGARGVGSCGCRRALEPLFADWALGLRGFFLCFISCLLVVRCSIWLLLPPIQVLLSLFSDSDPQMLVKVLIRELLVVSELVGLLLLRACCVFILPRATSAPFLHCTSCASTAPLWVCGCFCVCV